MSRNRFGDDIHCSDAGGTGKPSPGVSVSVSSSAIAAGIATGVLVKAKAATNATAQAPPSAWITDTPFTLCELVLNRSFEK